jgi:hypothetical protein
MKLPHSANKQNHTLKQAQELQYTILMKHGKTSIWSEIPYCPQIMSISEESKPKLPQLAVIYSNGETENKLKIESDELTSLCSCSAMMVHMLWLE